MCSLLAFNGSSCLSNVPCLFLLQVEARLSAQTPRTLRLAMAPKLGAVQSCGRAAAAAPLACSVLFSSVSSIAGFSGHANYAAANAALDAVAQWQAASGAPAVAVQWGAWASVGELGGSPWHYYAAIRW